MHFIFPVYFDMYVFSRYCGYYQFSLEAELIETSACVQVTGENFQCNGTLADTRVLSRQVSTLSASCAVCGRYKECDLIQESASGSETVTCDYICNCEAGSNCLIALTISLENTPTPQLCEFRVCTSC